MADYIHVITTTKQKGDAERIARTLVEARLAACVQILGPITSIYWWKENIENGEEWLCLIKSRKDLFTELEKAIKEIHPYQIPEIIAIPIITGSRNYLKWLSNQLK